MLVVPVRRSSRCGTLRAPLPACRVTWKVASRAPSGAKAAELVPTRARTLPTKARARVGGGRATAKAAALTASLSPGWKLWPDTVTVRLAPWTPELGATPEMEGISGKVTVAEAEVPSAKLAATVKLAPLVNGVGLTSEANTTKAAPSATAKLAGPCGALRDAR